MRRLLPRSLIGQIALVMAVALLVAQAINFLVVFNERQRATRAQIEAPAIVRFVGFAQRIQTMRPGLRDQVLALRMAVIFCHARRDPAPAQMRIGHHASGWTFAIDGSWADAHPQSMHLLREEEKAWSRTAWPLQLQID